MDPKEGPKLHHSLRQKLQEEKEPCPGKDLLGTPAEVTIDLRVYQEQRQYQAEGTWGGLRVQPSGREELG